MNTPTRHDTRTGRARRDQHSPSTETEIRWRDQLPADWADAVDPPLHFRHYREYEISAERSVGYDEDEQACFITHRFALTRLVSDDDEEFYETVTLSEEMTAWRLRDGRWLVLRKTHPGTCQANRGFYAISPDMPR